MHSAWLRWSEMAEGRDIRATPGVLLAHLDLPQRSWRVPEVTLCAKGQDEESSLCVQCLVMVPSSTCSLNAKDFNVQFHQQLWHHCKIGGCRWQLKKK